MRFLRSSKKKQIKNNYFRGVLRMLKPYSDEEKIFLENLIKKTLKNKEEK